MRSYSFGITTHARSEFYLRMVKIDRRFNLDKRTFSTKSLSNQWSPKFNQQFSFSLPSTEPISCYLLQVTCRDYCLMSNDKVIGLSSIRLNEVQDQGTCAVWVTLAKREKFDDTGWTILRILSQDWFFYTSPYIFIKNFHQIDKYNI